MAMCHGNPDYARLHPGLMACAMCACYGPAPHPVTVSAGYAHSRLLVPALAALDTPPTLPVARHDLLSIRVRARKARPLEQPPRVC